MLFEFLLIIAIVMVCSTMGFVTYTSFKKVSFSHDAAQLRLLFHTAATRARCLKKEQRLMVHADDSTITFNHEAYTLTSGYHFGVLPNVYGPPSSPQKLIANPVTFTEGTIIAHPDGTLQAGTVYITDDETQYAVTTPVSAFSHIRVYRYKNNIWQKYL